MIVYGEKEPVCVMPPALCLFFFKNGFSFRLIFCLFRETKGVCIWFGYLSFIFQLAWLPDLLCSSSRQGPCRPYIRVSDVSSNFTVDNENSNRQKQGLWGILRMVHNIIKGVPAYPEISSFVRKQHFHAFRMHEVKYLRNSVHITVLTDVEYLMSGVVVFLHNVALDKE